MSYISKFKSNRRYKRQWLVGDRGKWILIALLVFAFPVGLYIMWDEGRWKTWIKIAVSVLWAVILVFAVVRIAGVEEPESGRQEIQKVTYTGKMLAPLPPSSLPVTSKLLKRSAQESTLISEPTPTPVPTMVYCNDNGKSYHLAGCRYVYEGRTPRVTLNQAKNAGKTACPYCNPPREESYNN